MKNLYKIKNDIYYIDIIFFIFFVGYCDNETQNHVNPNVYITNKSFKYNDSWSMHFNSGCSRVRNDMNILLVSQKGTNYSFTFIFYFGCTNNMVQYNTLLYGLNIISSVKLKSSNIIMIYNLLCFKLETHLLVYKYYLKSS